MWKSFFLIFVFCWIPIEAAANKWIQLSSTHFDLYTTMDEKKAREVILFFEQVRDFFDQAGKPIRPSPHRVRIVAFRHVNEFAQYRTLEWARSFQGAVRDQNYIALYSADGDFRTGVVHEYIHLLLRTSGVRYPLWLDEGLATLYGTFQSYGDSVKVGSVIKGHVYKLSRENWLDLAALFAVDRNSAQFTEDYRVGLFYAQSWALTHMLAIGADYRNQFGEFLRQMATGLSSGDAVLKVYGKTTKDVFLDLRSYWTTPVQTLKFDIKLAQNLPDPAVVQVAEFDARMMLASLMESAGKKTEAAALYGKLASENPTRPEAEAALGFLALAAGKKDEAVIRFSKAADLGSTNAQMYFEFALLGGATGQRKPIELLLAATRLKPDYREAHYRLGLLLIGAGRDQEGIVHLAQVKAISKEHAATFYHAVAYANARMKIRTEARRAAENMKRLAARQEEIADAEQLLKFIDDTTGNEQLPPLPASLAAVSLR